MRNRHGGKQIRIFSEMTTAFLQAEIMLHGLRHPMHERQIEHLY
jgi:hypothetical protein